MATARKPLMAGNWKMNLNHLEAIALVQKLAFALTDDDYAAVVGSNGASAGALAGSSGAAFRASRCRPLSAAFQSGER